MIDEQPMTPEHLRALVRAMVAEYLQEMRPSSVAIGRTASGATTIDVKEYSGSTPEAARRAQAVFERLCNEYPAAVKGGAR